MTDSIEKYLFEYNSVNPFFALMYEGAFGFSLCFFYGIYQSPLTEIIAFQKNASPPGFSLFIFALILFSILSGLKNSFRVITTKIYTPMTTAITDYILNPFYIILYFILEEDFLYKGKRDYSFFITNLILSIIISFFGCVYNDFVVLYFCGLEKNTYQQVSERAYKTEGQIFDLQEIIDNNDEETLV